MGSLLAAFAVQTALVYTDDTADRYKPLGAEALRGRRIWHEYNCQTCHQIHGFGGFLGPDLTNASKRLTPERLREVLTVGSAQMPAFHLDEEQIGAVSTFLAELSEMGVGVPRRVVPVDPAVARAAVDTRLAEADPSAQVHRGATLFQQMCSACHVPLQATPLGMQTAPDLTTACQRLEPAGLRETITKGRVERGMPAWQHLGDDDIAALCAFVTWLNEDREALQQQCGGAGTANSVPWWEYK